MPVRFKDTAEYHQRFSPKVAQKLQTSSSRVSDLSSGNQPLVSILKTSSVLPTGPDDGRGDHSDDYVLLGSQSKFAPSVRYRLRPTAIHRITPPPLSLPPPPLHPPPLPPPHQEYTDASLKSLHRKEDVRVRGQSSSPGKDDVEGSVLIGQRMNSRRSQGSQSNAVGDSADEVVGRDRKTTKKRLIGLDEKKKDGFPLTGITRNDNLKGNDESHCLGKTYNVSWRRRRRSGSPLSQNDSFPRSSSKQQQQRQQQELHHHHHQRDDDGDDDGDELNFSKDGQLRLSQATQTNERSHRRSGMEEEESNQERQGRRRRTKEEGQENKENRHSRSDDNRPISWQDGSYHRNINNNSNSTANQKTMLNYDDSRKKEKPGGQREHSGETSRGRETEATGQKGRRTEPESVVGYKVRGQHYASSDRTMQKNVEEMKSKKKSDGRIQQHATSSSSASTHPPPPLPSHLPHHHAQQQQPKRSHARETELKSVVESSRQNVLRRSSGGEGIVGGRMMRMMRDGKTSSSDVEMQRDAALHHPVTSSVHHHHHLRHDESISSEEKRNSTTKEEEEEKKKRSMRDHHQSSSQQMKKSTVSNVTSTTHNVEHTRLNVKQHLPPSSSSSSKAEHTSSSSSHATSSATTRDETTQTKVNLRMSDVQTTTKREDGIQPPLKSFVHLKNQHPSNQQMQLPWKQQPVTEAFVEQQQQQPTSASQHHQHQHQHHHHQQQHQHHQHPHRSASVISLSHPDFRTLFTSHRKVEDDEGTEYRFQFRPISARNNPNNDRRNFDSQPNKNEMRRGQSLGDLSTGERDEKNMKDRRLIIVRHDDQPKKYRSEYMRNFQPPWNYQFEDGTWKETEKRKRRDHSSQVAAEAAADDDVERSSNHSSHHHHHLLLQSSSSSASSWFEEVLELRRHADEYRRRANGTHFSREQLKQFYAGNVDSRGDVTEVNDDDVNDCNYSSRRNDDSFVGCDGKRTEDERMRTMEDEAVRRRRRVIEDGGRGERTMDNGEGGGGSGGRPLRHHFDRTSHKLHLPPHHHHHPHHQHMVRQQQQPHVSSSAAAAASSSSGEDALYDDSESSTAAATVDADHLTSRHRHRHEDKGVQIALNDGKAFQQSNQHRKILSSSSLASKVLERARNRNDEFWSK